MFTCSQPNKCQVKQVPPKVGKSTFSFGEWYEKQFKNMDIEPNNIGALLLGFMQSNQHEECEKLMDKLQALLSEELTETAIGTFLLSLITPWLVRNNIPDTYIINIFDADKGVLFFINETSYLQNRPYRKARSNAFKVLFVLLNNFPSKIKRYVKTISLTCLSSACSLLASSDEKEQALKVLKLLIEKEIFSGAIDEVVQIYSKLYNCRMVEKGDKGLILIFILCDVLIIAFS